MQKARHILTLARPVAAQLGAGWTAAQDPNWPAKRVIIAHSDGRSLCLHEDQDRLTISGRLPNEGSGPQRARCRDITVRTNRGPKVIAAEISRRLLPAYTTALAQATGSIAAAARRQDARAELGRRLAPLIPGARLSTEHATVRGGGASGGYAAITILVHGDAVNAEFTDVPAPVAEALAKAYGESVHAYEHRPRTAAE